MLALKIFIFCFNMILILALIPMLDATFAIRCSVDQRMKVNLKGLSSEISVAKSGINR